MEQRTRQLEKAIDSDVARLDLWTELIAGLADPVPSYDLDQMIQNTAQSVHYGTSRGAHHGAPRGGTFHDDKR